jgi:hypothetical protein
MQQAKTDILTPQAEMNPSVTGAVSDRERVSGVFFLMGFIRALPAFRFGTLVAFP